MKADVVVPTENVIAGIATADLLVEQAKNDLGCFGIFHGPSGTGKTFSAKLALAEHNGLMVRGSQAWATGALVTDLRGMLWDIWKAADGWEAPKYSVYQLYNEVREQITRRTIELIIIDEADYLALRPRHEALNVLRDIADTTHTAILFLSVLDLEARFATPNQFTETLTSRKIASVPFRRPSSSDAALFAKMLLEGVTFRKDLIKWCLRASKQSVRPLLRLYSEIEKAALNAGISGSLTLSQAIEFGLGPVPRMVVHVPMEQEEPKPDDVQPEGKPGLRVVQ
jgi:DNA transposition AAA+ family ATPase